MYKRGAAFLILCNMIVLVVCFNLKSISINRLASSDLFERQAYQSEVIVEKENVKKINFLGLMTREISNQRVLQVNVLEKEFIVDVSEDDYNNLLKIVEAEAGGEDETGKLLVANVIINRVMDESFPNTVTEVIYQKEEGVTQFSPTKDGRMEKVTVSEETINAVKRALLGEDVSKGALYFVSRKAAQPEKMKWFDIHLTKLFTHGGHEFYL